MATATEILNIIKTAKAERWSFPKTFDKLKKIGVVSYEVSWENGYHAQYNLDNGNLPENNLEGFSQPKIANEFSAIGAKKALITHQQGKTTYIQWMHEMAAFGVANYIVDMHTRNVTYYNCDKTQSIVEPVPEFV